MEWKPIKRLLVPFDFSINSRKAMEYALEMSEMINSQIIFHHVQQMPVMIANEYVAQETDRNLIERTKQDLERVAQEFRKDHPNVKIQTGISVGTVVDEILNAVNEKMIDMIVMGTRGAHGIGETFFGSNTADVIGKSAAPVLVVPQSAQYKPIKQVVFTTSFLENDFQTLFQLTELLKPFNAEIEVLHVEEQGERPLMKQMMDEFTTQVGTNITYKKISFKVIHGRNIEHALEDYVESAEIDLLSIASKRRNYFEKFTERSLSRKLAFHTRIPLLVFHSYNKTSYPFL